MNSSEKSEVRERLLKIQSNQLEDWKKVLKDEVYKDLLNVVEFHNILVPTIEDPWKIKRGVDIELIIKNDLMKRKY